MKPSRLNSLLKLRWVFPCVGLSLSLAAQACSLRVPDKAEYFGGERDAGGGAAGNINVGGTGVTAGSGSPGYVRIYFAGVSAAPVPTLGQWALAALSLLMMGFALQRRKIGFRRR